MSRPSIRLGFMFFVLLSLSACFQPPPASSLTITINAPDTLVSARDTTLTATIEGSDNKNVSWSVEGGGSFSDVNANPTTFTAPGVTSETTVTVKATAVADATKVATKTIKIILPAPLETPIIPEVKPAQASLPDGQGKEQPVGASRDEKGVQSDFLIGQVLVRPKSDADLQTFLQRYEGTVIGDNSVPEPPANLGITLTPEQRKATEYLVKINLAKVDLAGFKDDAAKVGMGGLLEVSSQDALLTLVGAADALAEGFSASPNYLDYPQQAFPTALLSTQERPSGGGFTNAFTTTRFQSTGSQSNVTLAWQFVAAHGVQRRAIVAIVDEGFWLDTNGNPRGTDSDFPAIVGQYDFLGNDYIADGPGTIGCGGSVNTCVWHGTGATGVAVGVINNSLGDAGTGGLVADVMLFKRGGGRANNHRAVRTAVAWGADVVSMSFGGDCDSVACRQFDRNSTPFDDAFNSGSRTVFVAAAGNGDSSGNGYDVGDPHFVHPCIEDRVICVGALNNDATTRIGYSNFGGGVEIFAPTNIPVMSQPAGTDTNPNGPASPQTFGGTSAATPFVAGVAAMMKAINPNLNTEDIRTILLDTAHKGASPVTNYIDAYAAVRKAAEGIDGVKDRFEPDGAIFPVALNGAGPWNNLNLHTLKDDDGYRFSSAGRSTVQIAVQYPETLGQIPWLGLKGYYSQEKGDEACGAATPTGDAPLGNGTGHSYSYTVGSGVYQFGLGGGLLNAYNLSISFSGAPSLTPDRYEVNDTPSTARYLYSFVPKGDGLLKYYGVDPAVTIDANLHTVSDVDYYTVRGVTTTLAQQILLNGGPFVQVYGNESAVTLEVYERNADGSQGNLVKSVSSGSCIGKDLAVPVESGKKYLVKVSGGAGNYTLFNGVLADPRKIPELMRNRIYEVLHPGEPIERFIRNPLAFILTGDEAYKSIGLKGKNLHLTLFDSSGNTVAEGAAGGEFDESISLERIQRGGIYALQITPSNIPEAGLPMSLSWDSNTPSRSSANLILNPNAEDGPANDTGGNVEYITEWGVPSDGVDLPTIAYYNGVNGLPSKDDPGPETRGERFFAGGPGNGPSAMRQTLRVPEDWQTAIDNGNVKFDVSAFLGGNQTQQDNAKLTVTFLNPNYQELDKAVLGPISAEERENKTGLFPTATSDYVPASTRFMYVDVEFQAISGEYNDGYADNLELVFQDYSQ